MSNYAALIVRQYGEGRIAVITDRVSGYKTYHGANPVTFWRQMLEWTAQRFEKEPLNIALVDNADQRALESLRELHQIRVTSLTLQDVAKRDLSPFHLLYVSGLPEEVSNDVHTRLETYVAGGGGLFIENPNRGSENINILTSMDNVYIDVTDRPLQEDAYWTSIGISHYMHYPTARVGFYSTLKPTDFGTEWSILMSDVETTTIASNAESATITTDSNLGAEFGLSYVASMIKGIAIVEEEVGFGVSSSSSSIDSSSSSSSSSFEDPTAWTFCDNIVAYWKLNEDNDSPAVWEDTGDFNLMGTLYNGTQPIYTSSRHSTGAVNGALSLDGSGHYIKTSSTPKLNFASGFDDAPWSISFWVKPSNMDLDGRFVIAKKNVWAIYLQNERVNFELYSGSTTRFASTALKSVKNDQWNNITITYDGSLYGIKMYHNGINEIVSSFDSGGTYNGVNDFNSAISMGTSQNVYYLGCLLDNILVVDKVLNKIEVESINNQNQGTEECEGIYYYLSSSSSSSSVSSSSSSSSIDSSSSTSFSSNSSSSSSSSISSSSSSSSSSMSSLSSTSESSPSSGGVSESSSSYGYTSSSSSFGQSSSSSSVGHSSSSSSSLDSSSSSSHPTLCDAYAQLVPVMTSNTAPAPYVASTDFFVSVVPTMLGNNTAPAPYVASASFDDNMAWKVFHPHDASHWFSSYDEDVSDIGEWVKIDLGTAKTIVHYKLGTLGHDNDSDQTGTLNGWSMQGSNDDLSWTTLHSVTNAMGTWEPKWYWWGYSNSASELNTYSDIGNTTAYRYYRIVIDQDPYAFFKSSSIYNWQLSEQEADSSTVYLAFDNDYSTRAENLLNHLQIDLGVGNEAIVNSYLLDCIGGVIDISNVPVSWIFQGSPNDINWIDLDTQTNIWGESSYRRLCFSDIGNYTSYRYYRVRFTEALWLETAPTQYGVKEFKLSVEPVLPTTTTTTTLTTPTTTTTTTTAGPVCTTLTLCQAPVTGVPYDPICTYVSSWSIHNVPVSLGCSLWATYYRPPVSILNDFIFLSSAPISSFPPPSSAYYAIIMLWHADFPDAVGAVLPNSYGITGSCTVPARAPDGAYGVVY